MQLTEHFSLVEFTQSDTATRSGIDNSLTPSNPEHTEVIANLSTLCTEVLEPLRRYVSQPVLIGSGYRSPKLNKAVGGVRNSQHMTGEAADISAPKVDAHGKKLSPEESLSMLRDWMRWIIDETMFDQCILEHNKAGVYWIHVSYRTPPLHNRHCVISNILKK